MNVNKRETNMKKFFGLTAIFVLVLAGCGDKDDNNRGVKTRHSVP